MQKNKIIVGAQLQEKFEELSLTKKDFVEVLVLSLYWSISTVIIVKIVSLLLTLVKL